MPINRVSATLSQADLDAVIAILNSAREKLPFLLDLTPEERNRLPKFGDKSQAFAEKALTLAKQNPDMVPKGFDVSEMERDFELFKSLRSLLTAVGKFVEEVEDTAAAAGSETYAAALLIYRFARTESEATAGLEAAADDLAQRFARKSRSLKTPPPAES
jgi:hypothetical protein